MDDAGDEGLLVVNLENCISDTADEQVVNDGSVYAVAVTSDTCNNEAGAVIQMPLSMHCSDNEQQSYGTIPQLVQEQLTSPVEHYTRVQTENYTQIEVEERPLCLNAEGVVESSNQYADVPSEGQVSAPVGLLQGQCDHADSSYYTQIYNYLAAQAMPAGATESYKKILKKRARNYKIVDGVLYYGQRSPKRVITEKNQQREIMRNFHIEEATGIHLGLRKMHMAVNQFYFWKGLYIDIAHFVRECEQCSETAELQPIGFERHQRLEEAEGGNGSGENKNTGNGNASKVWQKVELKLCGPYPKTALQNEFIITIADSFSHWIVARPVSGSNHAHHIADFVYKTFCTFGFAKCSVIGVPQGILETTQTKYKECVSRLRDTLLTCGIMVPQRAPTCGTAIHSLHVLLHDNVSQCTWVENLLNEFVQTNPQAWDVELERFLFEYCTTAGGETSSPFTVMFGRSPISYLEDDKENMNMRDGEKPTETISKRRRLQSTILQCRHCEEVFTSKISFRIHQRKHTEEACRQGTLEGQVPIGPVAEREKRLLKRTVLKQRQKLLKHGHLDRRERLMTTASQKLRFSQECLPKDKRRAELQANTVAAVRKLMATTKEERRRRGKYHKYPAELQEEMALHAMEHGNLATVRFFSQQMGIVVSESTVRNIVKLYRSFTPGLKEEIGRFAVDCGVDMACSHFTQQLGQEVRRGLVCKFKKLFLSNHPDIEVRNDNSNKNKGTNSGVVSAKQKNIYTNELKDEIGSYACHFGVPVAVEHFAQKLPHPLKESTVRKFRKLYRDKHCAKQHVAMLQQQLHLANPIGVQEAVGPSSAQTIDILHSSLNILNNAQVSGPATVVYNTHIQPANQLIPVSNTTSSLPFTFHPVNSGGTTATYQQQTPVVMNQSAVAFDHHPAPLQDYEQSQPVYSSYDNQGHSDDSATVPVSHKSVVQSVPVTLTQTPSQPPESTAPSLPQSSIPTITVAIATHSQQQFQAISSHSTVVVPHQTRANEPSSLDSQRSILLSHEQSGTTVVQQLVTSSHPHMQQEQQQSSLSHDLITGTLTNPASQHHSQVVVQQPAMISDSLLVEQHTVADHSQVAEHHSLESATFVRGLHDGTESLPFDASGATLIADRDGTYSIETAINNDISVTVEEESVLQTGDEDVPVTIQTQETQTQHDTGDMVVSIVPQDVSKRLKIGKIPQLSESVASHSKRTRFKGQETKVIHVVKVNCGVEEDVDPEIIEGKPKRKRSVRSFRSKKKACSAVGRTRGNYTTYSPEVRAEMGKYAAEHGSQKACQHFRAILGHDIPESTIRGLRDKYLLKREHCGSSSDRDKEVTCLGYAPRGRPMRLGKYDEVVQECIRELIKAGEPVSSFLAIATAKQVLMQYEPALLEENGAAPRDGNHRELIRGEGKGSSQHVKKTVMESESVLEDFYHVIAGQCLGLAVIVSLSLQRPGFDVGFVVDKVPLGQVSLKKSESKEHLHLSDNCASQTSLAKDSLCPDSGLKNSTSCLSEFGVPSVDSESIQNVGTPIAYEHDSSRTGQEETSQSSGTRQCRILDSTCNSQQMAVVEGVHTYVQDLRHSSDINILVYTETVVPGALQTENEQKSADYMREINQRDSSGMQQNAIRCEDGTANKPCGGCSVATAKPSTDVFHCDICGKIFLNKGRLVTHIDQHASPTLKCTHCSYTTKSSRLLDYHQNVHTGKFKCKICDKLFTRKIYLTYHLNDIHRKTRHLHGCEECSARFVSSSGLKMHMQTVHEPLKNYPCVLCKYVGNNTNSLASHMLRSHRKKYKCELCDYGSLTQGGLDKHIRIYHNPEDRQFVCKLCLYRGLKRRQLLDHERIVHGQDKNTHVCPVCKKSFRTQVLMKHHLPAHSDQHLYSCRRCSYTARYRQTFHLHLKHSHPTESFKNLCNGPSEADFEAIISTALKTLEPFPASDEQNLEIDYTTQVPEGCPVMEDSDQLVDVPALSEHLVSEGIPPSSQDTVNSCAEDKQNHVNLLEYPEQNQTDTNPELMEGVLVTRGVADSASELNIGNIESEQAVTIIDGSGLTSDEVQKIVGLAGDLSTGKQEVCRIVTLAAAETEKTLFHIGRFNLEDRKIHQVVTFVNDLDSVTQANEHAVRLLNNVTQCEAPERTSVAHVSVMDGSDINQGNLEVLPLGDTQFAVVPNDSSADRRDVLDKQTALLNLVAQQSELAICIKPVDVRHLDHQSL